LRPERKHLTILSALVQGVESMANRLFRTAVLATIGLGASACVGADQEADQDADEEPTEEARRSEPGGDEVFTNQLGEGSPKIRRDADGEVYVYADGDLEDASTLEWYSFTGSPFPAEELQYGIGKDRIRAIDDPLFVSPDDPRLLAIPPSPYRKEPVETADDIMVIGYVMEGEPRAYPTALLDRHEVVNDEFKGKPVAVGW
jgi:hypothetical protein